MSPGKDGHTPAREVVVWSDKMNEYLIDSLLDQKAIGNWSGDRFFPVAYDNIISGIRDKFGVAIDRSNIKNRLRSIKESLSECKNLFGEDSRIKWSPISKRFNADPYVWKELIERKPQAKKWMTKTFDHYDRLVELFGKDREKRLAVENAEGTPKKKARKEPPREHQHIQDGLDFTVADTSDRTDPDEASISGGLDLSEMCRTETGIIAIPVCANAYGKGLPYAPENWPCHGDQWYWRVGSRTFSTGHWADRYLTPPSRFRVATGKRTSFASRSQVEEFIKREYPNIDTSTFFSMFIWKIPAKGHKIQKGREQLRLPRTEPEPVVTDPAGPCKARNNFCHLEREEFIESSPAQDCDTCCTEPGFCRECCCILCRKTIDYHSFGGYSYIKCEAVVEEKYICGHVAHLDCALRCYMAGTVGGITGLDVQYHCRRCDNKTNLMMHVEKLMETCRSLESRGEIEPILDLGLCILRGSSQTRAKNLEDFMGSAVAKLKCGIDIAEVWNMEGVEDTTTFSAGENSAPASGVTVLGAQHVPEEAVLPGRPDLTDPLVDNKLEMAVQNLPVYIKDDHNAISGKFEEDIDLALQAHQHIPNGLDFTIGNSSDTTANENEAPDEEVIKQSISGELDLSESCRTETGIIAIPVCANAYGKGLPYAPENWPCPGDQWYWRVGSRSNSGGHWADRYLTPPSRFRVATGRKTAFTSRSQVEEFIKREYPNIDPSTFFSMFIWKIPAKGRMKRGRQQLRLPKPKSDLIAPAENKLEKTGNDLKVYISNDQNSISSKFEEDIDLALRELKKSQEAEYKLAEEKLYSQKEYILSLYRQLESERAELADPSPLSHIYGALLSSVQNRVDQINSEEEKFKTMLKVAGGFWKTPKSVAKELFGLSANN